MITTQMFEINGGAMVNVVIIEVKETFMIEEEEEGD